MFSAALIKRHSHVFFRAPTSSLQSFFDLEKYQTVYQLAEDEFTAGNLLVAINSALGSTDGLNISWVAGNVSLSWYAEDNYGTDARFRTIRSFEQWNRTHVIVVDEWNHCLRWVERENDNATSVFAGMCEMMGEKDGSMVEEAEFYRPTDIAINKAKNFVYVTDFKKGKIRMIDLYSNFIHTLYNGGNRLYPMGLTLDSSMSNLLVTVSHGIRSIDVQGAGRATNITQQVSGRNLTITSPISATQWQFPDKIIHLAPDLYAVVDRSNRRIGLMDNSKNRVTSICARIQRRITANVYGNSTDCEMYNPHGVAFIGNSLYIGTEQAIAVIDLDISAEETIVRGPTTEPGV